MLEILKAGQIRFCDHLSRREALQVGSLGTMGLGLPTLLQSHAQASPSAIHSPAGSFGKAKRVILLFMWGGPAHQDTWDLKPKGPAETRGEFLPIATNVAGMHISEHFPMISRHADKLAIIRSVGQGDNNHLPGAYAGLTGRRHAMENRSVEASDTDFPQYGAVLSKLRPNRGGLPTFVAVPEMIHTTNGMITPGQGGGLLGKKYDPFQITEHPDRPDFSLASLMLPEGLGTGRMTARRHLLRQIDQVSRLTDRSSAVQDLDSYYQQALDMLLAPQTRAAFDLSAESDEARWRYGWQPFGQSVLLARRLIEAGIQLVTVYWHRDNRITDTTWDTHSRNFYELKDRLMPSVDRPIAALLEDLAGSGLLDETLIVWNSEFGRTPRINKNAGRDHWGPCNSVVMAGGGMTGGQVFGQSDAKAAYPISDKVTQDDIAATIYHLLGLEPETLIYDRLNRPLPIALGQPIEKLLGGAARPQAKPDPKPRAHVSKIGRFARMLTERSNRHLSLDCGNPDSETLWELTGWGKPVGRGLQRYRELGPTTASVKYLGVFYTHFNYSHLVFRLAEPRPLQEVKLSLRGRTIPISTELANAPPATVWQIPFPDGMISQIPYPSTKGFDLNIDASGWKLTDLALVGEKIEPWHLARVS